MDGAVARRAGDPVAAPLPDVTASAGRYLPETTAPFVASPDREAAIR